MPVTSWLMSPQATQAMSLPLSEDEELDSRFLGERESEATGGCRPPGGDAQFLQGAAESLRDEERAQQPAEVDGSHER